MTSEEQDTMYRHFDAIKHCQESMTQSEIKFYDDILMNTAPIHWTKEDLQRTRKLNEKINCR